MGFYFHRIPAIVQFTFHRHKWKGSNSHNELFLTFDDGPTPGVSDFVLDQLAKREMKGTFFCLGRNLVQNQALGQRIVDEGHLLANHGYEHLDGWRVSKSAYMENIMNGAKEVAALQPDSEPFFRPAYGHFRRMSNEVMWSLMSGDFDSRLTKEKCLNTLIEETRAGDIVLFHDNKKSFRKLQWVLPRYLDFCQDQGFVSELIKSDND